MMAREIWLAILPALLLVGGAGTDARAQGISFAQPLAPEVPTLRRTDKDKGRDATKEQARRPAPSQNEKSEKKQLRCARPPCSA